MATHAHRRGEFGPSRRRKAGAKSKTTDKAPKQPKQSAQRPPKTPRAVRPANTKPPKAERHVAKAAMHAKNAEISHEKALRARTSEKIQKHAARTEKYAKMAEAHALGAGKAKGASDLTRAQAAKHASDARSHARASVEHRDTYASLPTKPTHVETPKPPLERHYDTTTHETKHADKISAKAHAAKTNFVKWHTAAANAHEIAAKKTTSDVDKTRHEETAKSHRGIVDDLRVRHSMGQRGKEIVEHHATQAAIKSGATMQEKLSVGKSQKAEEESAKAGRESGPAWKKMGAHDSASFAHSKAAQSAKNDQELRSYHEVASAEHLKSKATISTRHADEMSKHVERERFDPEESSVQRQNLRHHDTVKSAIDTHKTTSTHHVVAGAAAKRLGDHESATHHESMYTHHKNEAFRLGVQHAADHAPDSHGFGERKVFISDLHEATKHEHGMSLEKFKEELHVLRKAGKIELARADLVGAMNSEKVERSQSSGHGEAHFVVRKSLRGGKFSF